MPALVDRQQLLGLLERSNIQLVEVLPPAEYAEELPGAVNLPLKRLDAQSAAEALDASRPVVVYCWDGL